MNRLNMIKQKKLRKSAVSIMTSILWILGMSMETLALEQTMLFKPPERTGTSPDSNQRVAGRTHAEDCKLASNQPDNVYLLVPKNQHEGQTVASHPSFWLYIPYESGNTINIKVEVYTKENDEIIYVYQNQLTTETTPGVISIPLPKTQPGLQEGKTYTGLFEISCQNGETSSPIKAVDGNIVRIKPKMTSVTENSNSREQALSYANQGIWYETLTILANRRCTQPGNEADEDWQYFLESVGLDEVSQTAIANCPTKS
jgi:hypothetical protein